jgi:hypothetical protein
MLTYQAWLFIYGLSWYRKIQWLIIISHGSHGSTPIAGWFILENPSINGWFRGAPILVGNLHTVVYLYSFMGFHVFFAVYLCLSRIYGCIWMYMVCLSIPLFPVTCQIGNQTKSHKVKSLWPSLEVTGRLGHFSQSMLVMRGGFEQQIKTTWLIRII